MAPERRGFGSRLIERSLANDLGGEARLEFAPTGLVCTIEAKLDWPATSATGR
jgi:two-component sensor histidine kinase